MKIVRETTGRARGRIFAYVRYLDALNTEAVTPAPICVARGIVRPSAEPSNTSQLTPGPYDILLVGLDAGFVANRNGSVRVASEIGLVRQ